MDNNTLSDMKIRVSDGLNTITYKLNETSAAKSLYQMLPLKVTVENYSNNGPKGDCPWRADAAA